MSTPKTSISYSGTLAACNTRIMYSIFFLLFVTITEFVPQFTNMSQQFETFRCSDDKAMKKTVHVFLMTYVLVGLKRQGKIRKYIVSQMIGAVGKNKAG